MSDKIWDKAQEAYRKVKDDKLPVELVAESYGISARALRRRLGTYERSLGSDSVIDSVLGPRSNTAASVATVSSQPTQETGAQRALASWTKLMTPEAGVATFDAAQQTTFRSILFLAGIKLDAESKDVIALSDVEKAMLEPWAGYAIEELPELLKKDPTLGLKIGLGIMGYQLAHRCVIVWALIQRKRELEASKHEPADKPSERAAPGPV